MISFPSIGQFREAVKNIQHQSQYVDKDADGNAIFDRTLKAPTLKYIGTCKAHGTNFSVCFSQDGDYWFQSRSNIITPLHDNAGSAMFAENEVDILREITFAARQLFPADYTDNKDVVIFGEWAGKGIQKGVAISEVQKMFIVFSICLVDQDNNKTYLNRDHVKECLYGYTGHDTQIYNIFDFPTFELEIDFENPHLVQNKIIDLTMQVEAECPIGKAFGVSGVGEGIVFIPVHTRTMQDSGIWFKSKGTLHSNSKVRTLASVDVERINNIQELAETLANNGRLDQIAQTTFDLLNGGEYDNKMIGEFIKNVMKDIAKEEIDVISASGFNMKEVSGPVAKICRNHVMKI